VSTLVDELFEVGVAEVIARDTNNEIGELTLRTPGTTWNLNLRGAAVMGSEVYFQALDRFNGVFLDTSSFEKLSRWASDRYGIARFGATTGVVELTFSRTVTTGEITITAGTVVTDPEGTVKFETDIDLVLAIGVSTGVVTATSTQAGRDQRAEAGVLTVIEGALLQPDQVVTNVERAAGGNDEESDFELRGRARGIFVNARRGVLFAIQQGAFEVPQVRNAAVYEFRQPNGCQTGIVGVVVSDQSGNCNAALVALVDTEMDLWRSAGIQVIVTAATPRLELISVTPSYDTGAATPANKTIIKQVIVARVNTLEANAASSVAEAPENSWLTPGLVEAATRSVTGVNGIIDLTLPAGIIKPGPGERILTTEGLVTVN
jgi:uncharacterized phage protein gp47/JayE